MVRVARTRARTDPTVLLGCRLGDWRTAQRTSKKSATIGIFSKTISQMKVQVVTFCDRATGRAHPYQPPRGGSATVSSVQRGSR